MAIAQRALILTEKELKLVLILTALANLFLTFGFRDEGKEWAISALVLNMIQM
jgi:hypothetical protein